jgi:hypothetical protein
MSQMGRDHDHDFDGGRRFDRGHRHFRDRDRFFFGYGPAYFYDYPYTDQCYQFRWVMTPYGVRQWRQEHGLTVSPFETAPPHRRHGFCCIGERVDVNGLL